MKTVTIKTETLLEHLRKNRAAHLIEFSESLLAYRQAIRIELSEKHALAVNNLDVSHTIKAVRPKSYESAYDAVIAKLEWTTEPDVTLDDSEFKMYVQDNWAWSIDFGAVAQGYKSGLFGAAQ